MRYFVPSTRIVVPRASAALGVVADTVAFDRILDGRQERIARIAKRPDEIPDQVQVGTGMERLPHDIREIVSPLVAAAEPAHAQRPLVAIDLAARQADVRLAEIVGREHLHRKAHGHLALHLHRKQLVVDHIVVAVVDATAVHPGAKLLEDGLIEGLAFGDIEVRHPVAADIIEVACRKRTGGLYRAVEAAAARTRGAFSARNQRSEPKDDRLRQCAPVSHSRKSMSWQHLASRIGFDSRSRRKIPRT